METTLERMALVCHCSWVAVVLHCERMAMVLHEQWHITAIRSKVVSTTTDH